MIVELESHCKVFVHIVRSTGMSVPTAVRVGGAGHKSQERDLYDPQIVHVPLREFVVG